MESEGAKACTASLVVGIHLTRATVDAFLFILYFVCRALIIYEVFSKLPEISTDRR